MLIFVGFHSCPVDLRGTHIQRVIHRRRSRVRCGIVYTIVIIERSVSGQRSSVDRRDVDHISLN